MDFDEQQPFVKETREELLKLFYKFKSEKGNNANRYLAPEERQKLCQILELAQQNLNQLWGLIQSSGQPYRPWGILNYVENAFNNSYEAFKYSMDMELKGAEVD